MVLEVSDSERGLSFSDRLRGRDESRLSYGAARKLPIQRGLLSDEFLTGGIASAFIAEYSASISARCSRPYQAATVRLRASGHVSASLLNPRLRTRGAGMSMQQ